MNKHTILPALPAIALATAGLAFVLLTYSFSKLPPKPTIPMCHDPNLAIAEFAAFADDKNFLDAHPAPLPIEAVHQGKMIEFPVAGGANGRGFLMTSHGNTQKYLLLFHEWWGLNDYVKNETSMWCHSLGINVLAIDLYDGKVATTSEEASSIMKANDPVRSAAIIEAAAKHLGEKADFRTMGWCFGGGWSLQAALLLKDKAKGCVMFYGMPEKDVEKLKTLACDALFVHATQDQWINDQVVTDFEMNMKSAGKALAVHRYDANHGFANPSGQRYHQPSATASRAAVRAYLAGK
ncbi:MAG: dienelactone hydrolase family protein [Saprospiraceae bacterium]